MTILTSGRAVEHLPRGGVRGVIPAMSPAAVNRVRELEQAVLQHKQVPIVTHHLIHAGMYARTVTIPAGAVITGALIKRATILILNGDATVATGNDAPRLTGYHVIPASAHRKQAFLAHADTQLTMLFPTNSKDVRAVEQEFTDEADLLMSRAEGNVVTITEDL